MKYLIFLIVFVFSYGNINANEINTVGDSDSSHCDTSNAVETEFYYDEIENTMTFIFNEEVLIKSKSNMLSQLKGQTYFYQEVDLPFPEDFSKELGSPKQIIVRPGKYKITYQDKTYKVFIPLKS